MSSQVVGSRVPHFLHGTATALSFGFSMVSFSKKSFYCSVFFVLLMLSNAGIAKAQSGDAPSLFGCSAKLLTPEGTPESRAIQAHWKNMLSKHVPEEAFGVKKNLMPAPVLDQWKSIMKQFPAMPPDKKLRVINGFFNNWPGASDESNYGEEEHWACPVEFLEKKSGDCEDYAIIKYLALRYLSWSVDDMWVVFVSDTERKIDHAVLVARANGNIFVLDNLSQPRYLIVPQSSYTKRFIPRYAINESGMWVYSSR